MGNKLGRRRSAVDEKYTRPQGLYLHKDIDVKKLKKLILESKLAPCYPGDEDCSCDLEECPICFLSYPSLNRSRCCSKSICTECFLQLKMPNATRPTQCPFCKTTNYAVEYRGTKTKKEKSMEQIEEQRVIEAKIRIRQQELQEEKEKSQQRPETTYSNRRIVYSEGNYREATGSDSHAPITPNPPESRPPRDGEFTVDLEDIMVMEAIWLSMQESNRSTSGDYITSEQRFRQDVPYTSQTTTPTSSSAGGLASAVATLVKNQQTGRDCSTLIGNNAMSLSTVPSHRMFHVRENNQSVDRDHEIRRAAQRGQDSLELLGSSAREGIISESFEEQMTLAMTVSLAEAQAITSSQWLRPRH